MIYSLILTLRNRRYRDGRHSVKAEVPTICVGNITVGGTGKTPHVEMILRRLAEDRFRFLNPAVLSRGYGRKSRGFRLVGTDSTPAVTGDEPLQIKRKLPLVTVAVDKDRVEGCRLLVHPEQTAGLKKYKDGEFPPSDVIVLDDAYQYRRLRADLNIVLVDHARPVTRDTLLPTGRLRDLKKRLYDADVVIVTKCPGGLDTQEKQDFARILGFDSFDPGTGRATRGGRSLALLFSRIDYCKPEPVFESGDSRYTYSAKAVMLTGIANDTPLRLHISDSFRIEERLSFPDHHRFTRADVRRLESVRRRHPTSCFLTTEKDAQRLRERRDIPSALQARLFYIPITVSFLSESESEAFDKYLSQL